jgi:hypothetical protein
MEKKEKNIVFTIDDFDLIFGKSENELMKKMSLNKNIATLMKQDSTLAHRAN